jgi:hypothetical protein
MPNPDELDLLDLRQLQAVEIHSWRKRQPRFCYPVSLASEIGVGPAAAIYYILSSIASMRSVIADHDIAEATGCSTTDIAAARAYGQRCGFLVATELSYNNWKYELQLLEFSKWGEQRRKPGRQQK